MKRFRFVPNVVRDAHDAPKYPGRKAEGILFNSMPFLVKRVHKEGMTDAISAQAIPENGHASSTLIYPKDKDGRARRGGRSIARWLSMMRSGPSNVTVVIGDESLPHRG